jgi:Flp pilus assembly protein TadG
MRWAFPYTLLRLAQRFRLSERGNVAITFGFAMLPLIGAVGAAVDYSRANAVKASMQAALDATALALSKSASSMDSATLQSTALKYFTANFNHPEATNISITPVYSSQGATSLTVNGSVDVPTVFVGVLGINKITLRATNTATWGSSRLQVALVLDNTGSMAQNSKMSALQTATKNLLSQFQSAASVNGDVYVSIIPFVKDVNVGSSNSSATWLDFSKDWTNLAVGGHDSTPSSSVGPGSSCPYSSWSDGYTCVTQAGGSTTTSNIPSSGSNKGYICPSNSIGCYDSVAQSSTTTKTVSSCWGYSSCSCTGSWWNQVCTATVTTTGYSHTWFADKTKWNGCVTDRGATTAPGTTAGHDQDVVAPTISDATTLFPAEKYSACPQAMMGLSYDWTGMTSLVNNMSPNGSTNQPIGLVWGWMSLVGGGPFSVPTTNSSYTYNKIIILLTDGLNTQDRWYGDGSSTSTSVDDRMLDSSGNGTCANIKAAGITLYTIQVNTGGDPTSTLLQNCASDSSKFFLLTSADQIVTTFQQIGTNLTQLYLSR